MRESKECRNAAPGHRISTESILAVDLPKSMNTAPALSLRLAEVFGTTANGRRNCGLNWFFLYFYGLTC